MTGSERRQELLQLLSGTQTPLSGTALAKHFDVSRQVIVQDMALLRAQGHEVLSTNRGYLIQAPLRVSRIFKVFHTSEQIPALPYILQRTSLPYCQQQQCYARRKSECSAIT